MKIYAPVALASALFLTACAGSSQTESQTTAAASVHNYQCESGATIAATYPTSNTATVQYQGNSYDMDIAVSASGARYVGDKLEWWTKGSGAGSEGLLLQHMADGTSGDTIESCTEH